MESSVARCVQSGGCGHADRRFGFEALLEVWILAIMVTPILGKENDNSEAVKDTQRTRGTGSRSPATHGCPSAFLVAMTFT